MSKPDDHIAAVLAGNVLCDIAVTRPVLFKVGTFSRPRRLQRNALGVGDITALSVTRMDLFVSALHMYRRATVSVLCCVVLCCVVLCCSLLCEPAHCLYWRGIWFDSNTREAGTPLPT